MVDQRRANQSWPVCDKDERLHTDGRQYQAATLAVLMDIRAELNKLNTLLHTPGLNNDMWGPSWLTAYIRAVKEATPALSVLDDRPTKCTHEPV